MAKAITRFGAAALALALPLSITPACGGGQARDATPSAPAPQADHERKHAPDQHAQHAHRGKSGQHDHMEHRFDRAEDWARLFDHPSRDAWQKPDEVVALTALSAGMTVVDVGAGTGYFMSRLSRAVGPGGSVVATDIEADMVRYMKDRAEREKLANVRVLAAPTDNVGVAASSADRILIVDVWHHIADRERYASRMARALKPGGAVVIVDFTMETRRGPPPRHRLAPDRVIAELEAGGLEAELVSETLPDQYVVVGRRR
jgi:ubiquinone/menaquinone biosynthesis C-methylase UbiE